MPFCLVLLATLAGGLPTFFVQGEGGTPLRYWVLGTAIAMFVVTAALLRLVNRPHLTAFAYWYSLALVATAVGLFGVMVQTTVGSLVNWAGRTTQYLGGVYMLIAALASARETRQWGIPNRGGAERGAAAIRGAFRVGSRRNPGT